MNWARTASSGSLGFVDSGWNLEGTGNYDGGGRAGIFALQIDATGLHPAHEWNDG